MNRRESASTLWPPQIEESRGPPAGQREIARTAASEAPSRSDELGSESRILVVEETQDAMLERLGMTQEEYDDVTSRYMQQAEVAGLDSMYIEHVDYVLRKMGIFVSHRFLWALCCEFDANKNNYVEIEEFCNMISKLRGHMPFSDGFHVRAVPRALMSKFDKVFEILDTDSDGLLDEDQLLKSVKELSPHMDAESEDFRTLLDSLAGPKVEGEPMMYSLEVFLVMHARIRKKPVEMEVAMLNLTEEEKSRYSQAFRDWRASERGGSTSELRQTLSHLGYPVTSEALKRSLSEVDADSVKTLTLPQFLFMLVKLGAGTSTQLRCIPRPGATYEECFERGFTIEELWELGYTDLGQIRSCGWSAHAVWKAGIAQPYQMRQVGFSAIELRRVGCSAKQLKLAGFSFEDLRNAGFSTEALADCHIQLTRHVGHITAQGKLELRPLSQEGNARGENRWWSTPRIQSMLARPEAGVPRLIASVSA